MSDHIRDKMLRFKADPPASAWEGIAAVLDENAQSFSNKLYNYQQQPGEAVWNKIAERLDEKNNSKLVPLKVFSKSFKYAAAAVVISIIALSVYYFLPSQTTKHTAQNTAVHATSTDSGNQNGTLADAPANHVNNNTAKTEITASDPYNDLQTFAETEDAVIKQKGFKKVVIDFPIHALAAKVPDVVPQLKNIVDEEVADRYMIATNKEGEAIKLPKKAYSDFACAEALTSAAGTPCKQKVENLQSKMAASMATDFAHFLDLLKNLQETR